MPSGQASQDNVQKIREAVARVAKDENIEGAAAPIVNTSGPKNIRIQTEPLDNDEATAVSEAVQKAVGVGPDAVSRDAIGATWGAQVADRALLGLGVFLVLVMLFIWAYFREWKMSVAAIVALAHDLVITIGVYALSGFEVTPATVTGILTILGFSLYDTVVVFDKVRENTKNLARTRQTYAEAANLAVNQTLVRSINTSIVALLPVGALLYVGVVSLGSGALKDLALALFVGMAAGAYSSIFIATPLLVQLKELEPGIKAGDARAMKHRNRKAVDPYASVPVFSEDMPVQDEPEADAGGGPRRGTRERAGRGTLAPGQVHRGGAAGVTSGLPVRLGEARAAQPQATVATRQVVSAGRAAAALDARLSSLIRDVADFPEPGVVFKDITPLLADHDAFTAVVEALADAGRDVDGTVVVDKVVGMEARGFILAAPVALALGIGFVPVRKAGKLPRETHAVSYALEYGEATLELHRDGIAPGDRVLLVDDVLATGGTADATRRLVELSGGTVHAFAVLMELSFLHGRDALSGVPLHTLQTV